MNIEIANRLVELRKKNGYSQEELAEKLGLSRQAVSKWERAESSPDTDNLICLAKLYDISLDDLLNTDQNIEEIRQEVIDKEESKKKYSHSCPKPEDEKRYKTFNYVEHIVVSSAFIIATIVYLLVSSFNPDQWGKLFIVFLIPIILGSIVSCIKKRRFRPFAYPILAVLVFLYVGLYFGIWHPTWIVFVSIPVFYIVFEPFDKLIANKRGEPEDPDDTDSDDEEK